jgi:oligosaccharide repeat unit polymerase
LQKQWFSVPKKIYWFLIFFQIISSVILYRAEKTAVISAEMGGGDVFDIINKYNVLLKFSSEDVALSRFPALLAGVSNGFMYISAYLMVSELIHQSRLSSRLSILAFTVSILVSLVGGSRSNAFAGVISCVILFLVFSEMNGKIGLSKIRVKNVAKILALIIFIFIAFYALIFVLDRDGSSSAYEYMSIYLTAPIKNLDLALTGVLPSAQFFGQYTFQYLYRALIAKYNFPPFAFVGSPHPFSYYDGRSLGNVYTIFRALMIDFGFWGSILAVMMIGVITQVTYEIVMRHRVQSKMYFSPIFYSFLGFNLMMSFFSENFYQNLVNTSFIKWMLSIFIFSYIFNTKLVKK